MPKNVATSVAQSGVWGREREVVGGTRVPEFSGETASGISRHPLRRGRRGRIASSISSVSVDEIT